MLDLESDDDSRGVAVELIFFVYQTSDRVAPGRGLVSCGSLARWTIAMNNAKHIPGGNEPKEPRRSLMQIDAERLRSRQECSDFRLNGLFEQL